MSPALLDNSYLLSQFHEFYSEVIHFKQAIRLARRTLTPSQPPEEGMEDRVTAHSINQRLLNLLEHQAIESGRRGGEYGSIFYKEAQYAMAVLGDETFLHLDWEGREGWKSNLLEYKLFGTHTAGEFFFKKVDKLLTERDPAFAEIALLYLLAISLGFQGKYRDLEGRGQLDQYRRQLYTFIFHKSPDLLSGSKLLFPEAYAYTLEKGEGKRLPHVRRWVWLLLLLIIAFLILSHGLWVQSTEDLEQIIQQILLRR
ncbi:MAG: DotU family type IV/VI secretion system protein [Pseudomonadota bacterium]